MITRLSACVLFSLLLLTSICRADHLPRELQARGNPEKRLAGIYLERSRLADVVRLYGKPSRVEKQSSTADFDMYDYYSNKPRATLHLVIVRGARIGEYISSIEVEGSVGSGMMSRTGAGLRLGSSLTDLRRIYGRRFRERKLPEVEILEVMVQWRRPEYSLLAQIARSGKIKKLTLLPPE
jgi:hypothetical protein